MFDYVARRFVHSLVVLLGVTTAAFVIIHLVPGNPVTAMLGFRVTHEQVALLRHDLHLDLPLYKQYWMYVTGALRGNLGMSISQQAPVVTVLAKRILPSFYLIGYATVLSVALSLPLGVLSAITRNRLPDHFVRFGSMILFAMPSFWVGLMLVVVFALHLGWLPVSGYGNGFGGIIQSLTLPAVTIALYLAPILIRTMRSSLIEALDTDYVQAARARGLSEIRVVGWHAMRNSLIATATVLSVNVGYLISGTVIIEAVFQIPGLGSILVEAILKRDYPLIQGLTILFGTIVVLINLLTDIFYSVADPRIRLLAR